MLIRTKHDGYVEGVRRCYFDGGDSSSSTTQNTTYNNYDQRVVNNNTTNVDAGALKVAESISNNAITTNATNADKLLTVANNLFSQQTKALDTNVQLAKTLAGTAQTAYQDAASQASGNKNLILAGMAVVGLAVVSMFKKP